MSTLASRIALSDNRTRIQATYEVTRDALEANPDVVQAMRHNLLCSDDDLLEITIMRLGLRAADIKSLDKIINIARSSSNPLVVSAAVYAMTHLAVEYPERSREIIQVLEGLKNSADDEVSSIIKDELLNIDRR